MQAQALVAHCGLSFHRGWGDRSHSAEDSQFNWTGKARVCAVLSWRREFLWLLSTFCKRGLRGLWAHRDFPATNSLFYCRSYDFSGGTKLGIWPEADKDYGYESRGRWISHSAWHQKGTASPETRNSRFSWRSIPPCALRIMDLIWHHTCALHVA